MESPGRLAVLTAIFMCIVLAGLTVLVFWHPNNKKAVAGILTSIALTPISQTSDSQVPIEVSEAPLAADQAPAVVTADDHQYEIDQLLEHIDVLERQFADAQAAQAQNDTPVVKTDDQQNNEADKTNDNTKTDEQAQTAYSQPAATPSYSKVIISEVQIGGASDEKEEFVELYNPNQETVNLTGWYIQRKTKTASSYSSYATTTLFNGKTVAAGGYFLVARTGYFAAIADIFTDNPLTEDNSLALKNPNGDIVDTIGWGQVQNAESAPAANPEPGQSIGRSADEKDTDNNTTDFFRDAPTPKAQNIAYVPPIVTDTTAPTVSFDNVAATQKNLAFTVDFSLTDPVVGDAPTSGIAGYTFRWQEESGPWNEDAPHIIDGTPVSYSGSRDFTGSDETNYYFQIKVQDTAGNESDWLPETPIATRISLFKKILISEIQTYGKDASDQFIELYNPNDVAVNVNNFRLTKKASTGTESNLISSLAFAGTIAPGGFFVIVPQSYSGTAQSNATYSGKTFSLAEKNNTVLLYDTDGTLLDKVGFGAAADFNGSAAANPPAAQSIGRSPDESDSGNNAADFELDASTPGAQNQAYSQPPEDAPPENPPPPDDPPNPQDTLAPTVSFDNLLPTQNSFTFPINFTITDAGEPLSGVSHYIMRWKDDTSDWREDQEQIVDGAPAVFSGTRTFTGTDGTNYYFQIKAEDGAGNESDWLPETPATTKINLPKKVVINEVQTFGTAASDQFVELYNPSEVSISLTGFSLKKKTSTGTESNLVSQAAFSGTIAAGGFFLVAPQNYTGSAIPNVRYSGASFSLAEKNNTVLLYGSDGTLMDKVGFGSAMDFEISPVACAGQNQCIPKGKSIQRTQLGVDTDNNSADFTLLGNPTPGHS